MPFIWRNRFYEPIPLNKRHQITVAQGTTFADSTQSLTMFGPVGRRAARRTHCGSRGVCHVGSVIRQGGDYRRRLYLG